MIEAKTWRFAARAIACFVNFCIGAVVAFFSEGELRKLIRSLYQWSTDNAFRFYGKDFIINLNRLYYLAFGLAASSIWYFYRDVRFRAQIKWTGILLSLFFATLTICSSLDAQMRIVACTMCDDGIMHLRWNDINYHLLIEISLLVMVAPLAFIILKKRMKRGSTILKLKNEC